MLFSLFSQSFLPFCCCFPFFLRIDKNSLTLIFAVNVMWPYYWQWPSCFTQLQQSWWDASAKDKDRRLTELGATFLYWFFSLHTTHSNHNNGTEHCNPYRESTIGQTSNMNLLVHPFMQQILFSAEKTPAINKITQIPTQGAYILLDRKVIKYTNMSISDKSYK